MDVIQRVLSIAGSDSGGGAGIQADLKAFAACGVYGMTAITAITAQNTVGVTAVHPIPPDIIIAQVRAVAGDIGVDAVKIGMLGDEATIEAVAQALDELPDGTPVVLDPVMVAESGALLLDPTAKATLVRAPAAPRHGRDAQPSRGADAGRSSGTTTTTTPSRPSPAGSTRSARRPWSSPAATARRPSTRSSTADSLVEIPGERHDSGAAHGSGCTHSSVLAARLAHGDEPLEAARGRQGARLARRWRNGLSEIGAGLGPVDILGVAANPPKAIHNDRSRVRPEAEV